MLSPQSVAAPSGKCEWRQAWCCLQVKLCDPCLSALRIRYLSSRVLYKSTYHVPRTSVLALCESWEFCSHNYSCTHTVNMWSKAPSPSWAVRLVKLCMCRSDAGCGYNQLVYSSLVGLKQQDRSLFDDSILAARWLNCICNIYNSK